MIPRVMDLRGTYKGGGGPDKTVLNSAAQHDPKRVHVLVTYLRQPWDHEFQIPEMARRLGINYVDIPDGKALDWECITELRRLLKVHDLRIVHAHDDKTLFYGWLLKLLTPGLRIMYTCHSHAVHDRADFASFKKYLSFKLRQKIQIFLMQRYESPVITVSGDTKRRLVRNGLGERDVAVLHNGIDTGFWDRQSADPVLRAELGIPDDGFLVGTVARITYEKDLLTFYRVAQDVSARVPKVKFVIVGDGYGDELPRAREDVARLGLGQVVHFTGHRNDLLNVYASFDVFLMTSLTEGLPNTLLEAMVLGVPSVSTSVGGVPELLEDGYGGFLAGVGDSAELARYVIALLKDPSLRERCGRECRERIESRFAFSRRVRTMEEYYAWFGGTGSKPDDLSASTGNGEV